MVYSKKCFSSVVLFWRMPYQDKAMLLFNVLLLGLARAIILTLPLRWIAPYLGSCYQTRALSTVISNRERQHALKIGRLVRLSAQYTPWNSNCFATALVAKFWCRHYHIPHVLCIGFAKSATHQSGYQGHAWLTAGPVAVTGGSGHSHYGVISTYVSIRSTHV